MEPVIALDEDLVRRLPLPLAQLYRHALNAKSALDRHQGAYFLWEAALKLLGSAAVARYSDRKEHDPQLAERLRNLARPSLGHWWEFVRLLLPALAAGDAGFGLVHGLLLGPARADLPRAAGLSATLREVLEGKAGPRPTVRPAELFDQLVRYRNQELGHGAAGRRGEAFYQRLGRALLAGTAELLGRLDVCAGRRLVYLSEVRREPSGGWLLDRYELTGEAPRRLEPLAWPDAGAPLPCPERVYLEVASLAGPGPAAVTSLHPLVVFDAEAGEALFLNARRGRRRGEYLSYTSGRVLERPDLGGEQRALLAQVLDVPVAGDEVEQWAARLQAEEGPAPAPGDAPAQSLGEFELVSKLGQGGMGVVYRAWQPSLGRQVALKRLLGAADARAEARFAREIRALGKVEHPNLVKVFTSGTDGDQWYYAMELVEGATLAAVCERLQRRAAGAGQVDLQTWHATLTTACEEARQAEKPVGGAAAGPPSSVPAERPVAPSLGGGYVGQVVELVRQVAEAAHALHEAGVVHRDLKPGNVMVSADGGHAVLMDLGLAQLADEVDGKLTRTRQFVGTLRYASPEQVLAAGRVDRRTDVYSLGATLWELLTLRPLYGATDDTPTPELMQRIQFAEPERPRKYHPGLPPDLEAVVLKCLEKDPGHRYATAKELADDLGRWQRGEPVQARPLTLGSRLAKKARRHRVRLAVIAVVLLLQIPAGIGIYRLFRPPAPDDVDVALHTVLTTEAALYNGGNPADSYRLSQGTLMTMRPFLKDQPQLQERLDAALARAEREKSLPQKAELLHQTVQDLRGQLRADSKRHQLPQARDVDPEDLRRALEEVLRTADDLGKRGDRAGARRLLQGAALAMSPFLRNEPELRDRLRAALDRAGDEQQPEKSATALREALADVRQRMQPERAPNRDTEAQPPAVAGVRQKQAPAEPAAQPPSVSLPSGPLSPAARTLVGRLLGDKEPGVRATAATALKKYKEAGVVEALGRALEDKEGIVRREAANSLAELGDPAAVPGLARRVADDAWLASPGFVTAYFGGVRPAYDDDPEWGSKPAALRALKRLAPDRVPEALLQALKSSNANVRVWAASVLRDPGVRGTEQGVVEALGRALEDRDGVVRREAANSLAALGDPAAVPALSRRVADDAWLASPGFVAAYVGGVRPAYDDKAEWGSKPAALRALRRLAPGKVEEALIKASESRNEHVRSWAVAELGRLKEKP
jgi:serine/threonine protein kinase/HEAT repeat protein